VKNIRIIQKKLLRIYLFPLVLILSLLFTQPVYAKIVISDYPQKIEVNKEFTVEVKLSGLKSPVHFLSIVFKKMSNGHYFGQTKNGEDWIEAESVNCKNFPRIEVKEGSWSGKLTGRVIFGEKDYDNSLGDYILKILKYTDACDSPTYSPSPSDDLLVTLFSNEPPPTSIPTVTLTPAVKPTVKPTHTPKPLPTDKPVQSKTVTATIVVTTSIKTTAQSVSTDTKIKEEQKTTIAKDGTEDVLGEAISEATGQSEKTLAASYRGATSRLPIIILVLSGLIFIGGGIFLSIRQINKNSGKSDLFP